MQTRLPLFVVLASIGAAQQVISSGTAEIPGTYSFSFDKGALVSADLGLADWKPRRVLLPKIRATVAYPGKVDFEGLTPEVLSAYSYGRGWLDATDSSVITVGTVIAVRTNQGNLAKAVIRSVSDRGNSGPLALDWVVYRASDGEVLKSGAAELGSPAWNFRSTPVLPPTCFGNSKPPEEDPSYPIRRPSSQTPAFGTLISCRWWISKNC